MEIGLVKEKLFTLLPVFEIEMNGYIKGRIEKRFSLFKPKYEIDYNGWRVEGDFLGWDYDVYCGCSVTARISKELFHWGDTYVIEYSNPEDEINALLLVLAIDAANCSNGNS